MKKKISKIMGVAVTIALLTSLLVASVPASAFTLRWFPEGDIPKTDGYKLGPAGIAVADMAVNGDTIYLATANLTGGLYRSTDGGASWTSLVTSTFYQLNTAGGDITQVAVSIDDPDVLVISTAGNRVCYSENGGASWSGLGIPGDTLTVADIDVSTGPMRYVVAVGENTTSGLPEMYKMYMAMAQTWTEEVGTAGSGGSGFAIGQSTIRGVKFSPNYQTDKLIAVVSTNTTGAYFQVFWDESDEWNDKVTGFDTNYPVSVGSTGSIVTASIAFPDTYLGTDYTERIAFVGVGTASAGGMYRLSDYSIGAAGAFTTWSSGPLGPIHSIAYHDSGKLVAGVYNDNKVYSMLSPLAAFPKAQREKALKTPGSVDATPMTLVGWSGDTVVAATSGDESAFAVSTDDGLTFNDTALIDTAIDVMHDVAVTPDGSMLYMATTNGTDASLWVKSDGWKRVLLLSSVSNNLIVRVAPDDSSAIYVAEKNTTKVYVSKDGGMESWKEVPCYKADTGGVQDIAVYDADTAYVLDSDGVSKTTNSGASWGTKRSMDGLSSGYDIAITPNGDVLVGGSAGVAFSTDEGASFTKITFAVGSSGESVMVIADPDYENNNTIYAAANDGIYRMSASKGTIPSSTNAPDLDDSGNMGQAAHSARGLAVDGDVLYVLSSNGSTSSLYRALNYRSAATRTRAQWSRTDSGSGLTMGSPDVLKMSDGPKFWAISSGGSLNSIVDPIAKVGPTLNTPADDSMVQMNPATGKAYNVTFSLDRYDSTYIDTVEIQIATDANFEGVIYNAYSDATGISGNSISTVVGPTGTEYVLNNIRYSTLVDFNPGDTYYWRARSTSTLYGPLVSAWSEARSFTIAAMDTFMISGPESGAADTSLVPTFTWSEYPDAIGYEIMLSEDPTFAIIEWSYNVDNPFYKVEEALKYSTTYYWRVRGVTGEPYLQGKTWITPAGDWVTGVFTTMSEPPEAEDPLVIVQKEPPPAAEVVKVEVPVAPAIPTYLLWVIVGVGAILVIALIVLIVRTRRVA